MKSAAYLCPVALAAPMLLGLTAPAPASVQMPSLAALSHLEQGEWEVREREPRGQVYRLCLGDARQLLQVHHPGQSCQRFIVADEAERVTVTYTCAGAGHGHTDLRIETSRLVQIESQGIASGAPFDLSMEGRWVGACTRARR